jgi:hypothetical protein
LKALYTKPIRIYSLDMEQETINAALGQDVLITPLHVHAQLNNLLRQFVGKDAIYFYLNKEQIRRGVTVMKPSGDDQDEKGKNYELATPITLIQLLNQVSVMGERGKPISTTWYISDMDFPGQNPEIRVVGTQEFSSLKLNQKIDISYKDTSLDKIYQDLASMAGVSLYIKSGSYLNEHRLSINMQNIPIGQAAGNIADMVGAKCIAPGYIEISGPGKPKSKTPAPRTRAPARSSRSRSSSEGYVGKISIPMDGGKYFLEFMIRESDLSDELKQLRAEKKKELLGKEDAAKPKPPKKPAPARAPRKKSGLTEMRNPS